MKVRCDRDGQGHLEPFGGEKKFALRGRKYGSV